MFGFWKIFTRQDTEKEMDKYLVVGLGNPDKEYDNTRHNIGYMIADEFVRQVNEKNAKKDTLKQEKYEFKGDRYAFKTEVSLMGRKVVVIKPTTYMNLSGKAVKYWLDKEKIPLENLFIIVDDLALPFGTIRLRLKGSDGGHNGLKDIIASLGTSTFNRLRFGIGNDFHKGEQVDFVLGKFSDQEMETLRPEIEKIYEILKSFVMVGMNTTMNRFNTNDNKNK